MGEPHKNKKNYLMENQPIEVAVENDPPSYKFTIDGEVIDLTKFQSSTNLKEDLGWAFARSIWRKRNDISAATAKAYLPSIDRFYEYLSTEEKKFLISTIDQSIVNGFIFWLKNVAALRMSRGMVLSESSKGHIWGDVREFLGDFWTNYPSLPELDLPRNAFDLTQGESFKPYSKNELTQIAKASFSDSRLAVNGSLELRSGPRSSPYIGVLIPHAIQISIKTGINPEVLFNLDVTKHSIKPSHIQNSSRLILPVKPRSGRSQNIELLDENVGGVRVKNNVVRLLEEVERLTEKARQQLPNDSPLRKKLWLVKGDTGKIERFNDFSYYLSLQAFAKRHNILADDGEILYINFKRFRPTFAEEILRINGGDVRDLQKRLGHSHLRTTMGYLDPNLEERKEAFHYSGLALVNWVFKDEKSSSSKIIAEDLDISEENASKLMSGEFNVSVGKCKNPFDSPLQGVKKGDFCTQYLACFRCHYSVILKEDGHRLFSFYHWLISKRALVGDQKWQESYEWIIDIIDNEIAPKLGDSEWVLSMKREAELNPFPLWTREQ